MIPKRRRDKIVPKKDYCSFIFEKSLYNTPELKKYFILNSHDTNNSRLKKLIKEEKKNFL